MVLKFGPDGWIGLIENRSLLQFFKQKKNGNYIFAVDPSNRSQTIGFSKLNTDFLVSSPENFFVKSSFKLVGYVL